MDPKNTAVGVPVRSAREAVAAIPGGATIAITGSGGGILEPDALLQALEERYLDTEEPRDLTAVYALGIGDRRTRGTNHLAHAGMMRRVIGGLWTWSPRLSELVRNDEIEAYALPGGVISQLFREIGARRPGLITRVGLDTFADPRRGGGKFNPSATEDLVELVTFDDREYLRYKPFRVDVALVRGDSADRYGNISCAGEAAQLDALAVAQAARGCGGMVIAQVKGISDEPFDPRLIHVPGVLVDTIVHHPGQWQTYAAEHDPQLCGDSPADPSVVIELDPVRSLIARRAATEVRPGDVLNVGFGVPALVVGALADTGRLDDITVAIEQGIIGGSPLSGDQFGASRGPQVMHSSTTQFDLIDGGLLDVCCLGMAQVDADGSVNVSRIAGNINGPGGFIDISQNSPRAIFCGTFTTGGLRATVDDGAVTIDREGSIPKFVAEVDEVTYSGRLALSDGRSALYITERAVFSLTDRGVELVEVAPGIDIDRDILPHMNFHPIINHPRPMDPSLFRPILAALSPGESQ